MGKKVGEGDWSGVRREVSGEGGGGGDEKGSEWGKGIGGG